MKKTPSDKKLFNDISRYVHKIITAHKELETLPNDFFSDWRERKKVKVKKYQLQFEIMQAQVMLRRKINRMMIEINELR